MSVSIMLTFPPVLLRAVCLVRAIVYGNLDCDLRQWGIVSNRVFRALPSVAGKTWGFCHGGYAVRLCGFRGGAARIFFWQNLFGHFSAMIWAGDHS